MRLQTVSNNGSSSTSPDRAPWWSCLLEGVDHIYTYANDAYYEGFSKRDLIGKSVYSAIPEVEGQGFFQLLRKVFESGQAHYGDSPVLLGDRDEYGPVVRQVRYTYSPVRNLKGDITQILAEGRLWTPPRGSEVSARIKAVTLGPKALTDAELLGLLLDEEDANRSSDLLHRFGTLRGVFSASPAILHQTIRRPGGADGGLHASGILRLRVASELQRRILLQRIADRSLLASSRLVRAYLKMSLASEPREQFRVLLLDSGLKLIADELMGEGTVSGVAVYTREVLRRALELSAHAMILVHNHPGRDKTASAKDIQITEEIVTAARVLNIEVHDHLIIAGDEILSLRSLGTVRAWGLER